MKFNKKLLIWALCFAMLPVAAWASGQELSWRKLQELVTKSSSTIAAGDFIPVFDHITGKVTKVDATTLPFSGSGQGGAISGTTITASTSISAPYAIATGTPSATGCTLTALSGGLSTFQFTAGATSCTVAVVLPAAPHGWWCKANDLTTPADILNQTVVSTTGCTVTGTVVSADVIILDAEAY